MKTLNLCDRYTGGKRIHVKKLWDNHKSVRNLVCFVGAKFTINIKTLKKPCKTQYFVIDRQAENTDMTTKIIKHTIFCVTFTSFVGTDFFKYKNRFKKTQKTTKFIKTKVIRFDHIFEKIEAKLGLRRYHDSALTSPWVSNQVNQFWPKSNNFWSVLMI